MLKLSTICCRCSSCSFFQVNLVLPSLGCFFFFTRPLRGGSVFRRRRRNSVTNPEEVKNWPKKGTIKKKQNRKERIKMDVRNSITGDDDPVDYRFFFSHFLFFLLFWRTGRGGGVASVEIDGRARGESISNIGLFDPKKGNSVVWFWYGGS